MNDDELIRYSRHILLNDIDINGVQNLISSRILIIGCGGLANIIAPYLLTSGVGTLGLIDDDVIELSNLSRQIYFTKNDIGKKKSIILAQKLHKLNNNPIILAIDARLNATNTHELFKDFDIIIDCSDNFATKQLANKVALQLKKVFVFSSAINFTGYFAVFDFRINNNKCLNCIFPDDAHEQLNCVTSGVYSGTVSLIGAMVVNEVLKIAGLFGNIQDKFIMINSLNLDIKFLEITTDPDCYVCKKSTD